MPLSLSSTKKPRNTFHHGIIPQRSIIPGDRIPNKDTIVRGKCISIVTLSSLNYAGLRKGAAYISKISLETESKRGSRGRQPVPLVRHRADLWGSYGARLYYHSKQEDLEHEMTINYHRSKAANSRRSW